MDELSARAHVVAAARKWIGKPYHHMADLKEAGCDCAMLLAPVCCNLGLIEPLATEAATRLAPS